MMTKSPIQNPTETLLALLAVHEIAENRFVGLMTDEPWVRVYGGQTLGQAIAATGRTVPADRRLHSLHAYFLKPGAIGVPIEFSVDVLSDSKRFSLRRVSGHQGRDQVIELLCSYHIQEQGWHHAAAMPILPMPEDLDPDRTRTFAMLEDLPIEMGPADAFLRAIDYRLALNDPDQSRRAIWFRVKGALSDDIRLHEAVLTYASDFTLAGATVLPHRQNLHWRGIVGGSLDHALWIHDDFRADDWLLYVQDGPWTGKARGIARGLIYAHDGRLVASVTQEALIRPRDGVI